MSVLPLMLIRAAGLPASAPDAWADDWTAHLEQWNQQKKQVTRARGVLTRAFDAALQKLPDSDFRSLLYRHRRAFYSAGKPVPEKYLSEYRQHPTQALLRAQARWQEVAKAGQACARRLHELFEQQCRLHPEPPEALLKGLLFASPDFLENLLKETQPEGKKARQRCLTLAQYTGRAAFKTAPFSHFTTVGLPLDPENETFISQKTQVTPNVALLPLLYEVLLQSPFFYRSLRVQLNPSGQYATRHTWELLHYKGDTENIQQIRTDALLDELIDYLRQHAGTAAFKDLRQWVQAQTEAGKQESEAFILKLLDHGLLEWVLPEKGLSASWAGNLYQYLGFLHAEPHILETLQLLQWLRGAARALPWQTLPEALNTLNDGMRLLRTYLERFGIDAAPPDRRFLFYEDVESPVESCVPPEVPAMLAAELADFLKSQPYIVAQGLRADFYRFAEKKLQNTSPAPFLSFAKKFIRQYKQQEKPCNIPVQPGIHGALLQIFEENGRWRAVVNALYPGGGKLLARWIHLLPASATSTLQEWCAPLITYPWQGWSNAGFQPLLSARYVSAPGGRVSGAAALCLSDLCLSFREGRLVLSAGPEGPPIQLNDAGLETPESRQPVQRLLALAGVPPLGRSMLPAYHRPWKYGGKHWKYRPRLEHGALVLERKNWQLLPGFWSPEPQTTPLEQFVSLRAALQGTGIPRRFFLSAGAARPEYFDQESPALMRHCARLLHLSAKPVVISEMLPLPEQCSAISPLDGTLRAAEWVLEWAGDV